MARHARLSPTMFDCTGCENFSCAAHATIFTFDVKNEKMLQTWWMDHVQVAPCCAHPDLYLELKGEHSGKNRCRSCHNIRPRYETPFFRGTKLLLTSLLGILWGTVEGYTTAQLEKNCTVHKKALQSWQYWYCELAHVFNDDVLAKRKLLFAEVQVDESAFGKRKNHVGKRCRNHGVEWIWGAVGVDDAGKVRAFTAQFIPQRFFRR